MNPKNLKYHREHDWARVEGDTAVFGLTSYAQETLGDIVYIELPEVGADVTAGTPYAEVESVKAVSDVYAPLSGVVVEVNEEVVDAPELINESPFEDGWLIKIRVARSRRDRRSDDRRGVRGAASAKKNDRPRCPSASSGSAYLHLRLKVLGANLYSKGVSTMDDTPFERLINVQSYSDEELHELADRLSAEEREISKRRRLLHGEIDILRAEIVRRLREKHSGGAGLVADGDVAALTDILSGKTRREPTKPPK